MRNFTEEQHIFRSAYRRFIEAEVAPHMEKWREQGIVDRRIFEKAGQQGFLLIWADQKYGGMGNADFRFEQIIMEENARAGTSESGSTLHSRLVAPYFDRFGTDEQKQRWLPNCVAGKTILAIAMTEPGAGSNLAGMRSTVLKDGDDYVLNGSKTYITNGINSDLIIVAAKSDPENNPHAMTLCVVERDMPGFERGRNLDKMGLKAQDTAELFFDNVRIPQENILGERHKGFYYLMHALAEERLISTVSNIANARRAFDMTRDYVMEREVFGQPLSEKQNTQFKMAEMDTEIDILQVYTDHCVAEHNEGRLTSNMAAKAKLQSAELEWKMLDLGIQLHGAAGYMKEYPISTMFTDARINRILAGSSEVMKIIIGRDIFSENYQSILN